MNLDTRPVLNDHTYSTLMRIINEVLHICAALLAVITVLPGFMAYQMGVFGVMADVANAVLWHVGRAIHGYGG